MSPNKEKQSEKQNSGKPGGPCIMVIFGAGGDLTKRMLLPALHNLSLDQLLPDQFAVVGVGRTSLTTEKFREKMAADLKDFAPHAKPKVVEWLMERLYYQIGDVQEAKTYEELGKLLGKLDEKHRTGGNHLFYLAIGPGFFSEVIRQLGKAGMVDEVDERWRRVIIEKPFGRDLDSAQDLNREIKGVLQERQIFRIDHYLGKETVQNILAFRFGNGIFEPIWNRRYIDHVQITVAETVGVENRGGYYDKAGALRDMVPNHIFQLITLTAMEPPSSFDADAVRDEQTKVLKAVQPLTEQNALTQAVRGQYGEGEIGEKRVTAYRKEPRVSAESPTETFVALKLMIDNWRWAGVPIYMRTGKRLTQRATKIVVQFKKVPYMLFRKTAVERLAPNQLVLHIAPNEGISLQFGAKVPGPIVNLGMVKMEFRYEDYFGKKPRTGYERLLYECITGDATLFQRADMVEASWGVVQPILDVWQALPPRNFPNYGSGTWGPEESQQLLDRDGRAWWSPAP